MQKNLRFYRLMDMRMTLSKKLMRLMTFNVVIVNLNIVRMILSQTRSWCSTSNSMISFEIYVCPKMVQSF